MEVLFRAYDMFFPLFSAKKDEIPFMLDELIRLSLENGKTRSDDPNYLYHRQQSVLLTILGSS